MLQEWSICERNWRAVFFKYILNASLYTIWYLHLEMKNQDLEIKMSK